MAAKAEICFHYLPLRFELFSRRNDFSADISCKICFSSQPLTWYFSSWLTYHFCWDSFNCNIIWWWSRNEFSWGIQSGYHVSTVTTTAIYTFGSGIATGKHTSYRWANLSFEKWSREGAKKCTSLSSWEVLFAKTTKHSGLFLSNRHQTAAWCTVSSPYSYSYFTIIYNHESRSVSMLNDILSLSANCLVSHITKFILRSQHLSAAFLS